MVAYIRFLSLEGQVSASSALQYPSAVSQYHINHGFASPTVVLTVRNLLKAYAHTADHSGPDHLIRTVCGHQS